MSLFPPTGVSARRFESKPAGKLLLSILILILILTLLIASLGCAVLANPSASTHGTGPATQQNSEIRIVISPTSVSLRAGAQQAFSASISNTADTGVRWAVNGGTISSEGVFTAPAQPASISVVVTATSVADPSKQASATVTFVAPSTLKIATSSLPGATSGTSYSIAFSAVGGQVPYRWALTSGTLPTGLTLDGASGSISGTPTQTGSFGITLSVTDSSGHSVSRNLGLDVAAQTQNGAQDGPAQLPRVYMQTAVADTPSPGAVVKVNTGSDLQGALNVAACGDTIEVPAGSTFTGTVTLPAKACDDAHWITVRTSAPDAGLPAEGTRVTPCYAGIQSLHGLPLNCASTAPVLARIVGFPPIQTAPGSNHYRLIGLELTQIPGQFAYSILDISDSSDHIVADRCWIHGTATDDSQQGVRFNSSYLALVDSFVSDIHYVNTDSQAVGGAGGTGPYKIVNNYLEGAGENVMFGGSRATTTPADIEIRSNHFYKPLTWMPGSPTFAGITWAVKDLFELKNGQRILLEGNIFENMWGTPIVITPKNQSNVCPICIASDITFRFNIVRHSAVAMGIANARSDAGGLSRGAQFISIHDDLFDDIDRLKWSSGASSWMFYLGACTACLPLHDIAMTHLTVISTNSSFLFFGDTNRVNNLAFTNNILQNGLYGAAGCGPSGLDTLRTCAPGASFTGNLVVGGKADIYPENNAFPPAWSSVGFANFGNGDGGDYRLQTASPYYQATLPGADMGTLNSKTAGVSQW